MSVQLDHAIVPARDRRAAAELLATLLGVPWAESGVGPFCPVYVNDGLTLDFDQAEGPFPIQHYCFRVSEAEFDGILARLGARGIEYRSTPHGPMDMQVNTQHGGRIVYWNEPDGHIWEALTVSYARQPQEGARAGGPERTRVTGLSMAGRIIFVNGASSSGKTTLCRALQAKLDEPFWHYSIDHFRGAGVLPMKRIDSGEFPWAGMRAAFFEGFHRCLPALAEAGNNLIVEHIVETEAWMSRLVRLLEPIDVFFVGLHCPLPELERRELRRGDRSAGEARQDHFVVHAFCTYDFEVDSTQPLAANADAVLAAWRARARPSAFARMLAAEDPPGRIASREGVA